MLPCFGFGWGDYQLTTYPVDLLSHLECPGFKIQVIPLKGADLTPAQACGCLLYTPVDSSGRSSS